MKAMGVAMGLAAALALAACSQEDAPSDEVTQVAEDIVDGPSPTPVLADGKYAPRDDCGKIEGADVFRERLALAIEARDAEGVAVLAAEDVKLDFGGGTGRAELVKRLNAPDGRLWDELEQLLALGCAENSQGGITLPWYFEQDIPGDPGRGMLVTGESVPLRAAADEKSETLATLNWDKVDLVSGLDAKAPFQHVELDDTQGYVPTAKLRSLLSYRLSASSRNGRWRITSLVAGD